MYWQGLAVKTRNFMVALIVLLGLFSLAAYAQDSTTQDTAGQSDSAPAAQPVLPANPTSADPNEAKALPPTPSNTPASRVPAIRPETYIIGIGDVLEVHVWKEGELSKTVPVRPDGMITLPLIGEIKAIGLTPVQLQDQLTTSLQKVVSEPQVTVMVVSVNSMSFNIMGNVNKPGYYPLVHPVTILDAIAISGGFRDFAKQKKIYVLRAMPDGKEKKYMFNYKQVIKGQNMAQNIMLQPHDVLVIP
jgi:polysaccharide export outer membrane protein